MSEEPPKKRARLGVGTSVANLTRHKTDDFLLLLAKTRVERLLPREQTIFATERLATASSAFETMVNKNFQSLPVLNANGTYHGFVDFLDLIKLVLNLFEDLTKAQQIDLEKLFTNEERFTHAKVHEVMRSPLTKSNPFHPIPTGFSLFAAFEILAKTGGHRIPIINEKSDIVDVVTQSMLIDFLWQNIEKIGDAAKVRVDALFANGLMHNLHSVKASDKAIDAFKLMLEKEVSGVGVLDDDGNLVDNVSLRDLKGIRPDARVFWRLWKPVTEYKTLIREEYPEQPVPAKPLTVTKEDTLYTIVEHMATRHVHKVYVVEKENAKPIRIISQTDVLRQVLSGIN